MDATEGLKKTVAEHKRLADEQLKRIETAVNESQESRHKRMVEQRPAE